MNECIIEISRDNANLGRSITVGVCLDGGEVGTLKNGEGIRVSAYPGKHELAFYRYGRLDKTVSFVIAENQAHAFFTVRIDRSNYIDVVNGLKSKQHGKKPSGCLTALVVTAAVVCAVLLLSSIFGKSSDTPKKVDTVQPSAASQPVQEQQTVFSVGETVELNNVSATLLNVTENSGGNYSTPADGKEFVICEFEIENNSSSDIAVSTVLSFDAYFDSYATTLSLGAILSVNEPQLDGTVAAGKKMKGVVGYEVSPDWSELEIRYSPSFWGREIIFQYKK